MEDMDIIELSSGGDSYGTVIEEMETADRFFSITIMGPPQPKPSPSFISWMRNGTLMRRVVNTGAPQMLEFKQQFIQQLRSDYNLDEMPLPMYPRGPINVDIWCYRKLPLTWFVANDRERGLRNQQMLNSKPPDKSTPDADNLAKFICDAINGVVYADDRQIARIRITKTFHTTAPFTGMTIVKFKRVVNSFGERYYNN